jgi:aspartyl-tRNA(Asn)/glutamyl-tRNA(Gln) amidotransferase subunit A
MTDVPASQLPDLSIEETSLRIRNGDLSPVALLEAVLERIERLEPRLQAWVTIDREAAEAAARRLERELAKGRNRGPLHGIPIGVKDIFYTRGLRTTLGSKRFANFVPQQDATCVARLRRAGAIILGKTVTVEFAAADPPVTVNPWDPARTPGGSSTGSAVAVATGMCLAAVGSQGSASTLRPAAYNGIVGLKPTHGRVSRYGMAPALWSMDHAGFLTRRAWDAATLLAAVAGFDRRDPTTGRARFAWPTSVPSAPPRIGVIQGFFIDESDEGTRRHFRETVAALQGHGAVVSRVELPDSFHTAHAAHAVIMAAEMAAYLEAEHRDGADDFGALIRAHVETGMLVPAVRYLQAQRLRRQFSADMAALASRFDALATPATPAPAPMDLTTTGDRRFQVPWSYSGLPTIAIPSGLHESGMPLGLQLIGRPWGEATLIAAAGWCEAALPVRVRPPMVAAA